MNYGYQNERDFVELFNNKIADVHYQRHIETKEQRIQELNVKLENSEECKCQSFL